MSAADIRTWAAEQGLDCPARGRIPSSIEAAYWQEHQAPLGDPAPVEDVPTWSCTVTIPGDVDTDIVDAISGHVLEAIWAAYHAGRAAERADIVYQLQGA